MIQQVEGLADLDRALGELPKATAKAVLRRTGLKALVPFVDAVRDLAPVDEDPSSTPGRQPGQLRDSYHVGTKLNASQAKYAKREGKSFVEVYAGTNDPAGVQQEFGNAHHGPQPHGRPAWDATQQDVLTKVKEELWGEIVKSARRIAAKRAKG